MAIGFGSELGKSVETLPQLDALASEELPCDDPAHHDSSKPYNSSHKGPGEWYVKLRCPECAKDYGAVYLICDGMIKVIERGATYECRACLKEVSGMAFF